MFDFRPKMARRRNARICQGTPTVMNGKTLAEIPQADWPKVGEHWNVKAWNGFRKRIIVTEIVNFVATGMPIATFQSEQDQMESFAIKEFLSKIS